MKVQANHGKVTQNMHGASRNYRYVWDVSILDMRLPSMSVTLFMCALMADMPSLYSCREIDDESSFANVFVKPSVLGTLSKRGEFEVAPGTSSSLGLSSCDILLRRQSP